MAHDAEAGVETHRPADLGVAAGIHPARRNVRRVRRLRARGLSEAYRCRSFPGGFCVFAGALVCPPCGGF
ncbi:hypothetical protein I548_3333 [Mycobacterium intracellulare]|nr:hypothetical protein I548_3333 [Mycobacterium intracellulare]